MRLRARTVLLAHRPRPRSALAAGRLAILLSVVAATSVLAQADETYILRSRAVIASDVVRLADIVDVPTGGDRSARSLLDATLWRAPPACQPMTATAADVVARLRQLKVSSADRAGFAGAATVRIESGCQHLERTALVAVAAEALDAWLRMHSDRFDRTEQGAPVAVGLPLGPVSLTARPIAPGQAPAVRMQIWVDVTVAGRFVRAVPLVFGVHAFRGTWLAAHDLRAGQALAEADLDQREIDVAASPVEPVRSVRDNVRLRKALLSGEALTASHMESRPPVAQGSAVVVMSRAGAFAVEARAEALQDGRVGQPVWVRVAASTGPVLARVVAENVVELARE